jgi:hypothetical protein
MTDDYQIEIPPSFQSLFLDARRRLLIPLRDLRERYELCEDLAQQMVDRARDTRFALGITEADVLVRCRRGLLEPEPVVEPREAEWVTRRLAELLGWNDDDARAGA